MEAEAGKRSIGIMKTEQGFVPVPMAGEKPLSGEAFKALAPEEQKAIESGMEDVRQIMAEAAKQTRNLAHKMKKELEAMAASLSDTLLTGRWILPSGILWTGPR